MKKHALDCDLSSFRHIPRRPSEEISNLVNDSAYRLVRAQEENMVLQPWVLLASLLLQSHHQNQETALDELTEQAVWLRDLSRQYGAFLHWPGTVRVWPPPPPSPIRQILCVLSDTETLFWFIKDVILWCWIQLKLLHLFFIHFSRSDHVPPSEVVSSSLSLHRGLVKVSEGRVQLALDQGLCLFLVSIIKQLTVRPRKQIQEQIKTVFPLPAPQQNHRARGSLPELLPQKRSSWARQSPSSPAPPTGTRLCTSSSDRHCSPRPSTPPRPPTSVRRTLLSTCSRGPTAGC